MIWIKHNYNNSVVTEFYINVIANAYQKAGKTIRYFENWDEISIQKKDIVVVSYHMDAFRLALKNVRYVYWLQGIVPEEAILSGYSRFRASILNIIEKYAIKKAAYLLLVSESMRRHFENKYKLKIENYHIMPCSNEVINQSSFSEDKKYKNCLCCYAGGLDAWQCFEETLAFYKKIEQKIQTAKLLLLVKDRETAMQAITKYEIHNYEIDYVSVEQLPDRLKDVKYGFILRKDIEVNRVATPTKLMTYMGNGIIPVLSDCLTGLNENLRNSEFVIRINKHFEVGPVLEMEKRDINADDVLSDYQRVFDDYYNPSKHITVLSEELPG